MKADTTEEEDRVLAEHPRDLRPEETEEDTEIRRRRGAAGTAGMSRREEDVKAGMNRQGTEGRLPDAGITEEDRLHRRREEAAAQMCSQRSLCLRSSYSLYISK